MGLGLFGSSSVSAGLTVVVWWPHQTTLEEVFMLFAKGQHEETAPIAGLEYHHPHQHPPDQQPLPHTALAMADHGPDSGPALL